MTDNVASSVLKNYFSSSWPISDVLPNLAAAFGNGEVNIDQELANLRLDPLLFARFYGCPRVAFFDKLAELTDVAIAEAEQNHPDAVLVLGFLAVMELTALGIALGTRPDRKTTKTRMARLLSVRETRSLLAELYHPRTDDTRPERFPDQRRRELAQDYWQRLKWDRMTLEEVGTTSLILRCQNERLGERELVLKLILYPYLNIEAISKATREYAARFGAMKEPWLTEVYASTSSWILMDWVDGSTLEDVLRGVPRTPRRVHLDLVSALAPSLIDAVQGLAQHKLRHEDLTPSNIIVRRDAHNRSSVVLIDLGRNYLYARQLGLPQPPEAKFVAPEVRDDHETDTSDLYSVGMLMCELLVPGNSSEGHVPSVLHANAPGLARILDDLVATRPQYRLLLFPSRSPAEVGDAIGDEVEQLRSSSRSATFLAPQNQFTDLLWPSGRGVLNRYREWRAANAGTRRANYPSGYLFAWSTVATLNWSIIFALCVTWGLREVGIVNFSLPVTLTQHALGQRDDRFPFLDALRASGYDLLDWRTSLIAPVVGFTTALAQTKYYQNIFSGVFPFGQGGVLAFFTEVSLRLVTVCTFVPVALGVLVQPRWTFSLLAAGCAFIALNNLLCYSLAARSLRESEALEAAGPADFTVLASFRHWWPSQAVYVVFIAAVAVGLHLNLLQDRWAYAGIACIVNVYVFYVVKSINDGPAVRGLFNRAFTSGERWQVVKRKGAEQHV